MIDQTPSLHPVATPGRTRPTAARRNHVQISFGALDGARAWLLTAASLGAVGCIALLDYATGPALSLSIFYLLPVAACAWWGGFSHGILLSLAGAFAWQLVDTLENPMMPAGVGLWNSVARFGTLVITSSLVSRLHVGALRERMLARTDPLTGAANGRTFYEAVAIETERAARTGAAITLAYLDLDNFKQLNDQLGHAAGDAALVDLVRLVRPVLRGADMLARLGGDEFALLLPEAEAAGALAMLTRLQAILSDEMARAGRPVTISVGAVTFLEPCWDVDLMVQQVDALMYLAKRRGKNRVEHTTVHRVVDLQGAQGPRLERRATARTVCRHAARVRPDGEPASGELYATVLDLSIDGVGLRIDQRFDNGSLLIVEPLTSSAKTLLARVIHSGPADGGWHHGCELPTRLSDEELRSWILGPTPAHA